MNPFRRFVADQDGFTLVAVTVSMMVLGLFAVGAWAASNNAMPGATKDVNTKRAYEAAEAGVQWYQFQIQRDTNFWTACADTDNQIYMGGGRPSATATAGWRNVPDSQEQFTIELMPNTAGTTDATCESDPATALLNNGVLTVRSTGRYNGAVRQIVAKFRRAGFIDYIYYTKWETANPVTYDTATSQDWARKNCDKPHDAVDTRNQRSSSCTEIQFKSTDKIAGPVHTEDSSFWVCGTPQFGDTSADRVEIVAALSSTSWYRQDCSGKPSTPGTLIAPAKSLQLPKNNLQLSSQATYTFYGHTCLNFDGDQLTVYSNPTWGNGVINCGTATQKVTLQKNTVIWVANDAGGCTDTYDHVQNYDNSAQCGDVAVSGKFSTNVTIGAQDDVIVTGDLTHPNNADALMGLVANQMVRVYHPVTPSTRSSNNSCSNNGGSQVNEIDAAILATQGSFIADNWDCGANLGTLTVNGAITQYWRGTVGTSGNTGYTKNYLYDKRLRYREPPNFLDPTTALWGLLRESEQSPVK